MGWPDEQVPGGTHATVHIQVSYAVQPAPAVAAAIQQGL
jgi:hypothetical protein